MLSQQPIRATDPQLPTQQQPRIIEPRLPISLPDSHTKIIPVTSGPQVEPHQAPEKISTVLG
jgi:hypothetical protein